jgi:methionine-rich copper-binding protein CopC
MRFRSTVYVIVTIALLAIGTAAILSAHAKVEKTEPVSGTTLSAAPKQLQLWFNEKIDAAVSKIELTGSAGKVALAPAHAMGDKSLMAGITGTVGDGAYTVAWQTAGDDGHVVKGDFTFTVKRAH